ncbi:prenylated rab acceptor PRA1 [Trametes versicolor FP-101664 SS1]|uniref:prenylated rab acceptor PRA1 n=1 Tax=Trametes versicolor (strain FP-101664) TaxID=717944 RepID=UPI0004623968|nr:prenylated rab acceptor PRA1 [Trametes versicolor FP-101664 SS1]EIW63333.1 prenylated rab acceptor PRA1 [Trametes versicolor FP-101664 SS1]
MEALMRATETIKAFRETRLSNIRGPAEFFDYNRVSRPADLNQTTHRISYNTRYFSGNYGLVVALLAVYAIVTNTLLIFAVLFLVGGFAAINRFAPDPITVGEHVITQKSLYSGLFIIGIPLLWFSSPFSTVFWLVGASAVLILGHASIMEPGIESEYATVQDAV